MYRPIWIKSKNLFSFPELNFEVTPGVATLVSGKNLDNDGQGSNGSGKSSLLEIFSIATTGTPLRKITLDEIINDFADEGNLSSAFKNDPLDEVLVIHRNFFRKSAQIVSIQLFKNGKEIEDPLLKNVSSVDEYNKFIQGKIGPNKDEIFNNFILSKSRYTNFLNMSDPAKKKAINTFSRGIVLDQAIAELKKDREPITKELKGLETKLAVEDGKVGVIQDQIKEKEDGAAGAKVERAEKLKLVIEKIGNLRKTKRDNLFQIDKINAESDELDDKATEVDDLANNPNDLSPEELIDELIKFIDDSDIEFKQSFKAELNNIVLSADGFNSKIKEHDKNIDAFNVDLAKILSEIKSLSSSKELDKEQKDKNAKDLKDKIVKVEKKIANSQKKLSDIKDKKQSMASNLATLEAKLQGTVTCPKCNFVFLAAESGFDVSSAKIEVDKLKLDIPNQTKAIASVNVDIEKHDAVISSSKLEIKNADESYDKAQRRLNKLTSDSETISAKITTEQTKIKSNSENIKLISSNTTKFVNDSFDEFIGVIDGLIEENDNKVKALEAKNVGIDGEISANESRKKAINENNGDVNFDDLNNRLKDVKSNVRKITAELEEKKVEDEKYATQEQMFLDFKTHLANLKVKAIGDMTNDFLEEIGSDLRVEMSGYTKLKNGKIREKISIKLLRDGVDAGSFAKFSAGEQARINLANILAIAKIININCDDGKGLDLLVLDEILDAVDEVGLHFMLTALNNLGITAFVVSHGLIAENYEHKVSIVKENGESRIETE